MEMETDRRERELGLHHEKREGRETVGLNKKFNIFLIFEGFNYFNVFLLMTKVYIKAFLRDKNSKLETNFFYKDYCVLLRKIYRD